MSSLCNMDNLSSLLRKLRLKHCPDCDTANWSSSCDLVILKTAEEDAAVATTVVAVPPTGDWRQVRVVSDVFFKSPDELIRDLESVLPPPERPLTDRHYSLYYRDDDDYYDDGGKRRRRRSRMSRKRWRREEQCRGEYGCRILLYRTALDTSFLLKDLARRALARHRRRCLDDEPPSPLAPSRTVLSLELRDNRQYLILRDTIVDYAAATSTLRQRIDRLPDISRLSTFAAASVAMAGGADNAGDFCYIYNNVATSFFSTTVDDGVAATSISWYLRRIATIGSGAAIDNLLSEMCHIGALNTWWVRRAMDSFAHHNGGDGYESVMRVLHAARFVNFVLTPVNEGDEKDFNLHRAANGCRNADDATCPWHAWTFVVNVCVRTLLASSAVTSTDRRFLNDRLVSLVSCGAYRAIVTIMTDDDAAAAVQSPQHRSFVAILLFGVDEMYVVPLSANRGGGRPSRWPLLLRRRRDDDDSAARRRSTIVVAYRAITSCVLLEFSMCVTATTVGRADGVAAARVSLAVAVINQEQRPMSTLLRRARRCALNEAMYDTLETLRKRPPRPGPKVLVKGNHAHGL